MDNKQIGYYFIGPDIRPQDISFLCLATKRRQKNLITKKCAPPGTEILFLSWPVVKKGCLCTASFNTGARGKTGDRAPGHGLPAVLTPRVEARHKDDDEKAGTFCGVRVHPRNEFEQGGDHQDATANAQRGVHQTHGDANHEHLKEKEEHSEIIL